VDAHTGAIPNDVNVDIIKPDYHTSPFTHHMTAQTLMELAHTLYHQDLEALIISVRGYEFGFNVGLSKQTQNLANQAIQQIIDWLSSK
jgi:Ni,Fe-hydrogenase maturation factor